MESKTMLYKKSIKASAIIILLSGMISQPLYADEEVQALVFINCPDGSSVLSGKDNCPAVVEVPEPSTLAIFALGVMGLALRRFKKQS
jgi:hypothetical protein